LPTVYDVPADKLIEKTAEYLRENIEDIRPLPWSVFVKTGSHLKHPPQNQDYWYIRSASILRKIYVNQFIGIERLRKEYGGRTSKGTVGKHKRRSGGAIIRNILKQLEKSELVVTVDKKGRKITDKGKSILDRLAMQVLVNLEKEQPELKKYM